ncbi:EMILIN-2-like [Engraulis encrasicolus]|uniref:EMILIN-2-like n=1 Tax=Engraulis encrasicolus TaxID=184585 RepID=UPI002FD46BF8
MPHQKSPLELVTVTDVSCPLGLGPGSDPRRVQQLEEEVQRLSHDLLDLQAAMTGMNANLRQDLQEDASKIFLSMLGGLQYPQHQGPASAVGGGTESIALPLPAITSDPVTVSLIEQLQNQLGDLSNTLATNNQVIKDLQEQVRQQEEQLRNKPACCAARGQQDTSKSPPPAPNPDSSSQGSLKDYVDGLVSTLRDELMEGMDIKMADLKNSCDYKVMSVQEQCEEQETSYLSLAEMLESKEAELRKEIRDLRLSLGDSSPAGKPGASSSPPKTTKEEVGGGDGDVGKRLTQVEEVQRELLSVLKQQNSTLRSMEQSGAELEGRVGLAERSAEVHCLFLEEKLRREREKERREEAEERRKEGQEREKERREEAEERKKQGLGNSSALEDLKKELRTHQNLIHDLKEALNATENGRRDTQQCCHEVQSLTKQLKGLEDSVSGLNNTVAKNSHDLQLVSVNNRHADSRSSTTKAPLRRDISMQQIFTSLDDAWAGGSSVTEAPLRGDNSMDQRLTSLEVAWTGVDGRVSQMEGVCGRLEPMSDSLARIKDGLNKHVTGLWRCVNQMNGTLRAHTQNLHALYRHAHIEDSVGDTTDTPLHSGKEDSVVTGSTAPQAPVLEAGEAGPPGTMRASRPPQQGSNGSMTPLKGYAGAPGYPPVSPVFHGPDNPSDQLKLKTVQLPLLTLGEQVLFDPVSFSAGLTLLPFPGAMGIIRFNKMFLNDGGHYDPHTGVFTVPVAGRYLISAVVKAERADRAEVVLSVSNHNIQRLTTSSSSSSPRSGATDSCSCDGSASLNLVMDLKRGDRVGLVMTSGRLAASTSSEVTSTFSAVLLYPTPAN